MHLRAIGPDDRDALWAILKPAFRAGDTYTVATDIARADALAYWCAHAAWIAWEGDVPLGTCYLRPNQGGGGAHVCNAGFVTAPAARGRGVARAMLEHVLAQARARRFHAMQFNFVVETNTRAVAIWRDYGFDIVGRLPQAFRHPEKGLVDALVMYKIL